MPTRYESVGCDDETFRSPKEFVYLSYAEQAISHGNSVDITKHLISVKTQRSESNQTSESFSILGIAFGPCGRRPSFRVYIFQHECS